MPDGNALQSSAASRKIEFLLVGEGFGPGFSQRQRKNPDRHEISPDAIVKAARRCHGKCPACSSCIESSQIPERVGIFSARSKEDCTCFKIVRTLFAVRIEHFQ